MYIQEFCLRKKVLAIFLTHPQFSPSPPPPPPRSNHYAYSEMRGVLNLCLNPTLPIFCNLLFAQLYVWDSFVLVGLAAIHFYFCALYSIEITGFIYPIYCQWTFVLVSVFAFTNNTVTNILILCPDIHTQEFLCRIFTQKWNCCAPSTLQC